ncbi:MAG: trehalose-phosphatase [Bosea sp.]|uniref:trehalose-phosphatase n=1 Tax=Bosea sp. (in: a-proteobacteria) TaxID=1871050 RepID=UPI00238C4711|nr:trehalose-phosphatase [Bosea sp. (in: a-proteobacteria)]
MTHDPLDPFGWAPERAGLFLDFDGVLSGIAAEPDEAVIRDGMADLLVELSGVLGRVAVISGRPVRYLDDMVPTEIDVVGLYGLEWRHCGVRHTLHQAEPYRSAVRELVELATEAFGAAIVEAKGLSLTLHYRSDPDLAPRLSEWAAEQAERTGMEHRPAKRSFELHPPIRRDKGTALIELAEDLDPVACVGDDLGDLPAFDGLDELDVHGVATLRVAVDSAEAPPILRNRADIVVDGPAGAEELLRSILAQAQAATGRARS